MKADPFAKFSDSFRNFAQVSEILPAGAKVRKNKAYKTSYKFHTIFTSKLMTKRCLFVLPEFTRESSCRDIKPTKRTEIYSRKFRILKTRVIRRNGDARF